MSDASQPSATIPGYNPGSPEVARSPITMEEWEKLKLSAFFSDEDIIYLRLSYDVLKDQGRRPAQGLARDHLPAPTSARL